MRVRAIPLLAISSLGAFACGNTVLTSSGTGPGGAGSAGHSSNGSTVATSGPSTTSNATSAYVSSSTGQVDPSLCDKFCAAVGTCFNNCQGTCKSYLTAPCTSQGAGLVACFISNFDQMTCQPGMACTDAQTLLDECRSQVPQQCQNVSSTFTTTFCEDTAECTGGEERTICDLQGQNAVCDCYLNAIFIATCHAFAMGPPTTSCDLKMGCCAGYFGK